jgi:N-acetylglucosamine malate deacetylase 1
MKVDILAIGVHPDDVELGCSGTLCKHASMGYTFGICDLTRGEMGSRGSAELRKVEAKAASKILGASFRVNLEMEDCFFSHNEENIRKIAMVIRQSQPDIVLMNAIEDRHPDHGRASKLTSDACFYAGLLKIEINDEQGQPLPHWRPRVVYHYIQDRNIKADLCIDITAFFDKKIESILAYSSQFNIVDGEGPQTPISSKLFFDFVKAKAQSYGRDINAEFAEGFTVERTIGVDDLMVLI